MNPIRAGRRGNVRAIVYQKFCRAAACKVGGTPGEFIQDFGCQGFFANLNQIDLCCDCGCNKLEDTAEVFTTGCRRCRRLAAGDEVADWLLRTVHVSYRCSHSPVAARRRSV